MNSEEYMLQLKINKLRQISTLFTFNLRIIFAKQTLLIENLSGKDIEINKVHFLQS